ncbi:MerR family transcriptional regulator [Nocardia sp. CDC153]|uniref:MerR family transcriptional regulator n=1 Tax=Nocardia sp. CDC153 TaxID=3112167 RepID=UPI002DBBE1D4|nr:MerR family transcriptional regulator [Nocardia sp. CDC153]MEC3956548.1 MerR family transcriptional regulator [Nocardia sp. CDC153]
MRIGELAERAGTSTRTIRYYEQHGLVQPARSANGYRVFDEQELEIVRKIRALLELGFDLVDARPFVTCLRSGHQSGDECPESVESLRAKLAEIDEAIDKLSTARQQLSARIRAVAETPPKCEFSL